MNQANDPEMNRYTHIILLLAIIVFIAATAFMVPQQAVTEEDQVYEPARWVSVP